MKINNAQLKIEIGANLTKDNVNFSGVTAVGSRFLSRPNPTAVLVSRFIFSAASQSALLNASTGIVSLSAVGTRQVVTRSVTAASGVTTAGNLACTFTGVGVVGSPLALSIPLNPTTHSTATAVATAIAAFINAATSTVVSGGFVAISTGTSAGERIRERYNVTSVGAYVIFTAIYGLAHDATASLAITTGLGVSQGNTNGSISGVLGVIHDRQADNGEDIYGDAWNAPLGTITDIVMESVTGSSVSLTAIGGSVFDGQRLAWSYPKSMNYLEETFTSASSFFSHTIVDVVAFCR